MSMVFHSSVCVAERLQVVRTLNLEQCKSALDNRANERLQDTVIQALQARVRRLSKPTTRSPS